jgi:hypothetical protein
MSEDPLVRLKRVGRCLNRIEDEEGGTPTFPLQFEKVCFICVNTSAAFRQNLGFPPLNDALQFAKTIKPIGFEIFFIENPSTKDFLRFFDCFIKGTSKHFALFYSGHGVFAKAVRSTLAPTAGFSVPVDPLVFDDGALTDEIVLSHISSNCLPGCRFTFVTDCCSGETIWNIGNGEIHGLKVPDNFVSISSTIDSDTLQTLDSASLAAFVATAQRSPSRSNRAKTATTVPEVPEPRVAPPGERIGLFTQELCKWLKKNPDITCRDLSLSMRKVMKKSHKQFVIGASQEELRTKPIFA